MRIEPSSLIMVCVLPKPKDLDIARLFGWYRIPLRSAPKVISVDYLAFYQPSSFTQAKNRIDFLAKVRGHELTTRKELIREEVEHPHANEEYFKIQLGQLEKLDKPIMAGSWKRFSFFYTTGEYLQQAEELKDLIVRTNDRLTLWKALNERAQAGQEYKTEIQDNDLSPEILMTLLGINGFSNLTSGK
ncbi:MAG TPA: hypothetical protein VN226_08200 [Anaerolineales bacterium]|nr:hypothetical protein [Anaerolineales bacterium]